MVQQGKQTKRYISDILGVNLIDLLFSEDDEPFHDGGQ